MGQANHVKANETLMKTDVFSMNSFKVLGFFKLYSEGQGGREDTVINGGEVHRYGHLKMRKIRCDLLLPWSTFW